MNEKRKSILMLLLKIAIVAVIFSVVLLNYEKLTNLDVRKIVESASSVYAAVLIIWGIFLAKSLTFVIPASLLYVSVGMAFEPLTAIAVSLIGIAIEVTATYILGNFLGGNTVSKILSKSKNGKKLIEKDIGNKFSLIFAIRFSGLPIDFTSLFLGASPCRYPKYITASLLGIMPRVILLTLLGDGIYDYIPMSLIIKVVICALPVVVIVFVIRFIINKRKETRAQ